jgi:hypothetical protein
MLNIRCKNIKNQFVIVQNSSLSGKIRNKLVIKIDVEPKTILYWKQNYPQWLNIDKGWIVCFLSSIYM